MKQIVFAGAAKRLREWKHGSRARFEKKEEPS